VYDVSRAEPTLLGKAEIVDGQLEEIAAIKIGEKRLLVTSQQVANLSALSVYDLTDLQKPFKLGNPPAIDRGTILQMTWNGSYLYAILDTSYYSDSDLLYVIDFDNNALKLRESLPLPGNIISMAVEKDLVALTGTEGLSIVSAVEPESLILLAQTTLLELGLGVAVIKDKALVVMGDEYGAAQLLTFDIQDPANPRQVEAMDISISRNYMVPMVVTKPFVILANGSGGVLILFVLSRP
jgi:hypothetical protein